MVMFVFKLCYDLQNMTCVRQELYQSCHNMQKYSASWKSQKRNPTAIEKPFKYIGFDDTLSATAPVPMPPSSIK